jgi:diguanylate cyclase (GGDEF)-like protein
MKINAQLLLKFFDQSPKSVLWAMALSATALLGLLDYLTGFEISFAFFYLLPVSLTAWGISRAAGFVIAIACAAIWLLANMLAGEPFSSPVIPYWNAITRCGFFFVVSILLAEVRQLLEYERSLARSDVLTGIPNSRAFYDLAAAEIVRAKRYHRPLTILYIDLDNFKSVNDRLGHDIGDQLLQTVAHTITHHTRAVDSAARLGGDEFAVLLPETSEAAAQVIVPRLRLALLAAMKKHQWPVTFSIGALTCRQAPADHQELIRLADQLMYTVKNASKDAISYAVYAG